ncbi:MAG: hypothetical protein AB1941_18300 [Gemmatimonadota bacterium]
MLQVKLHSISNATPQGEEFAARAAVMLQRIVNDPQFLAEVRAHRYSYTARMIESGDVVPSTDNETVAQIIADGKEVMGLPDGVIDLTVRLRKFSWFYRNTMGSVIPPNPTISTNRKFYNGWLARGDVLSAAAHWMHEWMHAAGFYHDSDSGDAADVPYAVGEIAVRVGQGMAGTSSAKSFGRAAPGTGYLEAAHEHACPITREGVPADLFDDG